METDPWQNAVMVLDPFLLHKAAECAHRMTRSTDPREQSALKVLHEMWTTLVNESASMSPLHVLNEIAAIEEIQSALEGRE